jgi:hypothetical protein
MNDDAVMSQATARHVMEVNRPAAAYEPDRVQHGQHCADCPRRFETIVLVLISAAWYDRMSIAARGWR